MRDNRSATDAIRRAPLPKPSMSFSFETDEGATVRSMVPVPTMASGSSESSLDVSAVGSEPGMRKRPRSFLVKQKDEGSEDGKQWDGASFGKHSTSTFSLSKGGSDRPRWGRASTTSGSSVTYGQGAVTPMSTPGPGVWGGDGSITAPGSVLPRAEGEPIGDENDFDRDYYGMEVRDCVAASAHVHVCVFS
jgi:hypothetical protein